MRKLYEINKDIENCILEGTDSETGEFTNFEKLEALNLERKKKIEGVALYIKDCRAEANAIAAEIKNLKRRMDTLNRSADNTEEWLSDNLKGERFSTSKVDCSFRKSTSVEVDDLFCDWAYRLELDDYITIKPQVVTPAKEEIKKYLKSGGKLEHCWLVEKQNLNVR